jgi:NAD(P)H-nitrite reductase large subunit
MTETPEGAILQRDKETYAIIPKTPLGLVNPDILEKIAMVARKYEVPLLKITSGQRLALVGIKPEHVEAVWKELNTGIGRAVEPCLHYVQACPGTEVCKFGQRDSLALGARLDGLLADMELPRKAKIGVSGCPLNCAESYMRDLGVFGKKKSGWTVIFGGNAGAKPRIGDVIAEGLTEDEVLALAQKCFEVYAAHGRKKERTARFAERIGIDAFKKMVGV